MGCRAREMPCILFLYEEEISRKILWKIQNNMQQNDEEKTLVYKGDTRKEGVA